MSTTTQAPPFRGVICPYCKAPAHKAKGAELYPHREPTDPVSLKRFWACTPCGAWVGCHEETGEALGTLANKELREARQRGHAAFDPLWNVSPKNKTPPFKNRGAAYAWLAAEMGLSKDQMHFARLTSPADVDRAIVICRGKMAEVNRRAGIEKRKAAHVAKKTEAAQTEAALSTQAAALDRLLRGES